MFIFSLNVFAVVESLSHVCLFATPWTAVLRLLCPRDVPGKNTRVCCHFPLRGIFPTQGSNLHLLQQLVKCGEPKVFHRNKHICFRSTLTSLAYLAIVSSPIRIIYQIKLQEPRRDTSMYFDHFHNRPTAYHSFPKPCIYNFYLFTLHYEDKIQ